MSSIRWLRVAKERKLYDLCLQHSKTSLEGAKLLKTAISDVCEGKYDELQSIAERIIKHGREADEIGHEVRKEVGQSGLEMTHRHDLLELLFHLETLADGIEASAYRMETAQGLVVPQKLVPMLKNLVDAVVQTILVVGKALDDVPYDWKSTLDEAEEIRSWETKVDDIRREAMRHLIAMADELGISTFWRIEEIIKHLEDAADAAESTANSLNLIIASRYE